MKRQRFIKYFILILIGICIFTSFFNYSHSLYAKMDTETANSNGPNDLNQLETQVSSLNNYKPVIEDQTYGLGSILVTNVLFNESGFLNFSTQYPEYNKDLAGNGLNVSYRNIEFVNTIKEAQLDLFKETPEDYNIITIQLNETLDVHYNSSIDYLEGVLIYAPRLYPCLLNRLYVHNASSPIREVQSGNYSIDANNNVVFDYASFFNGAEAADFKLYFIWKYNITITNWAMEQIKQDNLIMTRATQNITGTFHYLFNVQGQKLEGNALIGTYPYEDMQIGAADLNVSLKIYLPDKELLTDFVFNELGRVGKNNITYVSFSVNNSLFDLDFDAPFAVDFVEPVNVTWAVDRLAQDVNYRERIYLPSIIWGPKQIFLKYVRIEEKTISKDQVIDIESQFGRTVDYIEKNFTQVQEAESDSLVFTEKVIQQNGLEIVLPYIIFNETCPFIIKYKPSENLRVIITDAIKMPLRNTVVKIEYYGIQYGTYISKKQVQPVADTQTNANGEILITNVPNGDYMLIVYQDGKVAQATNVMAYKQINYVITTQPHVPLVLMGFLIPSAIFFFLGVLIYLHNIRRKG